MSLLTLKHALFDQFGLNTMLDIFSNRYPFHLTKEELIDQLNAFDNADTDPDPNCLLGKHWELIKYDFEEKILYFLK